MTPQTVGRVEEFPPGSKVVVTLEDGATQVGVFNVDGELYGLANVCPHLRAPLCLGRVTGTTHSDTPHTVEWVREGEILRCPWHAWEFDIKTGQTLTTPRMRARKYKVYLDGDNVVLEV